jgi:hypothetical protein
MTKGSEAYTKDIAKGLSRAYESEGTEVIDLEIEDARLAIVSDLHKGARDGADDFLRCERAYHAALAQYLERGFTLCVIGDCDELWENHPPEVLDAYRDTLALEAEFHALGRYQRFWGNHDDLWRYPAQVAKHLHAQFPELRVHEALRIRLLREGGIAGELFLVHGHQGTLESERFSWFSRLVVRYIWRPLQRRLNMASSTPARDYDLRQRHDSAMFSWARLQPTRPILIAGHTHRPVFGTSRPQPPRRRADSVVATELEGARAEAEPDRERIAALRSELELIRAEQRRGGPPPLPIEPPCYFNTGCCSFGDGDITGLEIADGEIRLVRWIDDEDQPRPKLLVRDNLANIVGAVTTAPEPAE